jgi:hypothetical protein
MPLSPQVRAAVDEIRRSQSLIQSLEAERDLWKSQAEDARNKMQEMASKQELSAEDRQELEAAVASLDELNDRLEGAAQANTKPEPAAVSSDQKAAKTAQEEAEERGRQHAEGSKPVEPVQAPLMPTLAFDPSGGNQAPPGDGQPAQPGAIETAGGFVIQGGATTQRAPGSRPESPSSSLVVPDDPNAKAPATTADVAKSGLGDSTGNEQIGNDLKPIDQGPGMPREPTDAEREAAQKQADLVAEEMARREANPLNLSLEDLEKRRMEAAGQPDPNGRPASGGNPEPDGTKTPPPNPDKAADGGEKRGE